jgi:hypothetical protein
MSDFVNYLISKLAYSKFIIMFFAKFFTQLQHKQKQNESNEIYFLF